MSVQPVLSENPTFVGLMNQMAAAIMKANSAPRALWEIFPKERAPKPRFYSFYFLDKANRIAVSEDRECESDAMAIAYGREVLDFEGYQKFEVLVRNTRVGFVHEDRADGFF